MKNSSKRRRKTAVVSAQTLIPTPPVALVLDGMISSLEEILADFERPVAIQVKRLIKLTTALRDEASRQWSGLGAAPRRKRGK